MAASTGREAAGQWQHCDVLLIDGRSGSGKTSYADRLAAELRAARRAPQILRVEDLYPGWDGLVEGSRAVARALDSGSYRLWDWHADEYADEVRHVDRRTPLIIEGCGAITRANLDAVARWAGPEARVRYIWLEVPDDLRKRRALDRDGDTFAPHWNRWAVQEDAHYAEHRPWLLAEVERVD